MSKAKEFLSKIIESKSELGQCYQLAYQAITGSMNDWTLVHGIATLTGGPKRGKQFGHAWLEKGNQVYDPSTDQYVNKDKYYRVGQISYTKKYSFKEVLDKVLETGHYGPWDKKIWDIDNKGKKEGVVMSKAKGLLKLIE